MKLTKYNPDSRKARVLLSSITGIGFSCITIALSFVLRTVLIKHVGMAYVGLYSFLTEMIGLLMSVDGGICSSLFIKIHKPIAENNSSELSATFRLIQFVYRIRSAIVVAVGVILFFCLPYLATDLMIDIKYIMGVYSIYLLINATGYLFIYYEFILEAYQKRYLTNVISFIIMTIFTAINIICLFAYESFVLYVVLITASQVVTYIVCSVVVKKNYPELFASNKKITGNSNEIKDMFKITYYTVSSVLVKNTDNILVTKMFGFTMNGIYSTYKMLNSQVFGIIGKIKYSVQDSARNYMVVSSNENTVRLIEKLTFLYFWISGFAIISLTTLSSPFIVLWLGSEYTMTIVPVFLTAMTLFIDMLISPMDDAFYSTETYRLNKYIPIIEVGVNLGTSIVFGYMWGISGVMVGTLLYLIYKTIARAYLLYNKTLDCKCNTYLISIAKYVLILYLAFTATYVIANQINDYGIIGFICKILICLIVPNTLFCLVFRKSEEFAYALGLLKKMIAKRRKRI